MIDQSLLKPVSSISPILFQIHREVACNYSSSLLRHITSLVHLSDEGIYEWHTSQSSLPALYSLIIGLPIVVFAIIDSVSSEHFVLIPHAPVSVEISHQKIIDEDLS